CSSDLNSSRESRCPSGIGAQSSARACCAVAAASNCQSPCLVTMLLIGLTPKKPFVRTVESTIGSASSKITLSTITLHDVVSSRARCQSTCRGLSRNSPMKPISRLAWKSTHSPSCSSKPLPFSTAETQSPAMPSSSPRLQAPCAAAGEEARAATAARPANTKRFIIEIFPRCTGEGGSAEHLGHQRRGVGLGPGAVVADDLGRGDRPAAQAGPQRLAVDVAVEEAGGEQVARARGVDHVGDRLGAHFGVLAL